MSNDQETRNVPRHLSTDKYIQGAALLEVPPHMSVEHDYQSAHLSPETSQPVGNPQRNKPKNRTVKRKPHDSEQENNVKHLAQISPEYDEPSVSKRNRSRKK